MSLLIKKTSDYNYHVYLCRLLDMIIINYSYFLLIIDQQLSRNFKRNNTLIIEYCSFYTKKN